MLNNVDEICAYANEDGTFDVTINSWIDDEDGKRKNVQIRMPRTAVARECISGGWHSEPELTIKLEGMINK